MTSSVFEVRARLSFPGCSRTFLETGRTMAAWGLASARILAPELEWRPEVEEESEREGSAWGATSIVKLVGTDRGGVELGRGQTLLRAGGTGTRVGGNTLIEIEAVRPMRSLTADNHCDVTHWDIAVAPVREPQIDELRLALESLLGHRAQVGGERRDPLAQAAQLIADGATAEDAAIWISDLASVGLFCRGHAHGDATMLLAERAAIDDVEALHEARIVLGEVLSEAGYDDWHERARTILIRLPS